MDKELERIAHNYWMQHNGGNYRFSDIQYLENFLKYKETVQLKTKAKVAMVFICVNEPYWPFLKDVIDGAKQFFLPGHDVEYLIWSDMPKEVNYGTITYPLEASDWPLPTLFRYHFFLKQEEKLKEYDYIFYCDADMKFVNVVGDEILGEGLTAAEHPMYSLRPNFKFPLEPNPQSKAYIKTPSHYYAGGFQGGTSESFITAMKVMKKMIDEDYMNNYIARWNDESHWNKYLLDTPPSVILSPSYVYPDSLIEEYYKPIWGRDYPAKLITITKKFTTSSEGGKDVTDMINGLKPLQL